MLNVEVPEKTEQEWNRPAPQRNGLSFIQPIFSRFTQAAVRVKPVELSFSELQVTNGSLLHQLFESGTCSTCCICLTDFLEGDIKSTGTVMLTACNHAFHSACLRMWARVQRNKMTENGLRAPLWCPMCRADLITEIP
jgi:hypothetical protein